MTVLLWSIVSSSQVLPVESVHKRIDGGSSGSRTPFFPHRRTLARAWTTGQGPFRPSICTLRILSGPRGAVYPIAASRRLQSVEPVTGPIFATRHARRARGWAGRMQLRGVRWQVYRDRELFGDVLRLDEGDQAERGLARRADNLKAEGSSHPGKPVSLSPDGGHRILRDQWIGREQGQSPDDSLTDQHAIEWILV